MNSDLRIVITGSSGFLGKAVAGVFQRNGINVMPVSRKALPGGVQVSDYRDTPSGDILIHLAEESHIGRVNELGEIYERSAIETLRELLKKNYKRIVYASSSLLYGDESSRPHLVEDEIKVSGTYLRVKRACEKLVLEYGNHAVVRLANLYGPGMSKENVLSTIMEQLTGAEEIQVRDDRPIRDFLWVEDAAEAIVKLALGNSSGIFNLGSGVGVSVKELAQVMTGIVGSEGRRVSAYSPSGKDSSLILDISKTCQQLGWFPRTSLRQGLEKILRQESR